MAHVEVGNIVRISGVSINGNINYVSLMGVIAADGKENKPLLVFTKNTAPLRKAVERHEADQQRISASVLRIAR